MNFRSWPLGVDARLHLRVIHLSFPANPAVWPQETDKAARLSIRESQTLVQHHNVTNSWIAAVDRSNPFAGNVHKHSAGLHVHQPTRKPPLACGRSWPNSDPCGSSPCDHKLRGRAKRLDAIAEMNMVKGFAHALHLFRTLDEEASERLKFGGRGHQTNFGKGVWNNASRCTCRVRVSIELHVATLPDSGRSSASASGRGPPPYHPSSSDRHRRVACGPHMFITNAMWP